jgi:hypothetical protein
MADNPANKIKLSFVAKAIFYEKICKLPHNN